MCGTRLRLLWLSLVLALSLCSLPCFSEVVLTDEEAQTILSEIEESRKELPELKSELQTVKNDCEEQKESYEKQLSEASRSNTLPWVLAGVSTGASIVLTVILAIVIL